MVLECSFSLLSPLSGFQSCIEVAPPPPEITKGAVAFLVVALVTLVGQVAQKLLPGLVKQHSQAEWRNGLGELMETKMFTKLVILIIILDLTCTTVLTSGLLAEYEEYVEILEKVGFTCLMSLFGEQLLHLTAFGGDFFTNSWFVVDLIAVSLVAAIELDEEEMLHATTGLCGVVKAFKFAVFAFDLALVRHEEKELEEKED